MQSIQLLQNGQLMRLIFPWLRVSTSQEKWTLLFIYTAEQGAWCDSRPCDVRCFTAHWPPSCWLDQVKTDAFIRNLVSSKMLFKLWQTLSIVEKSFPVPLHNWILAPWVVFSVNWVFCSGMNGQTPLWWINFLEQWASSAESGKSADLRTRPR